MHNIWIQLLSELNETLNAGKREEEELGGGPRQVCQGQKKGIILNKDDHRP